MKLNFAALLLMACAVAMPAAYACGICIDDKVASAYDHAVVQNAWKHGKVVVFCELTGPHEVKKLTQEAKAAAQGLRGVDDSSIRTGQDLAIVSFVLDGSTQTPAAAVGELQQRLKASSVMPKLLKVLEKKKPAKS